MKAILSVAGVQEGGSDKPPRGQTADLPASPSVIEENVVSEGASRRDPRARDG